MYIHHDIVSPALDSVHAGVYKMQFEPPGGYQACQAIRHAKDDRDLEIVG